MTDSQTTIGTFSKILQYAFWTLLLVVFPLTLDPISILEGGGSRDRAVLIPKALMLTLTWFTGLIAVVLSYPKTRLLPNYKTLRGIPVSLYFLLLALVAILVSALTSPYASTAVNLIGSRERLDGALVQITWYSLAFIGAALTLRPMVRYSHLIGLIAVGSSLVALWTLLQGYGIEPLVLFGADWRSQNAAPIGPLANSGYVGGYVATLLLVMLAWIMQSERFRPLWALPIVLSAAAIVMSENRAGALAVLILWPILAITYAVQYRRWMRIILLSALLLGGGVVVWASHHERKSLQPAQLTLALQGEDNDTNIRLVFWSIAAKMLRDTPWLGFGPQGFEQGLWQYASEPQKRMLVEGDLPENAYNIVFTETPIVFYNIPERDERQVFRAFSDKAHNYLLDFGLNAGLIGLAAFMLAYLSALWSMFRARTPLSQALAFGLLGYGVFGMTWFASLAVDPVMSGLLGAGIGAAWAERDAKTTASGSGASAEEASDSPPRSEPEAAA
ncbi:MAG: O-antigen ligase family protein [Trueperaceae bacterium]|nr:O-antigen ligase family protein [Trueperaceae bacterium]